jgi:diguanylate cyclase (GGDEF)-like protein
VAFQWSPRARPHGFGIVRCQGALVAGTSSSNPQPAASSSTPQSASKEVQVVNSSQIPATESQPAPLSGTSPSPGQAAITNGPGADIDGAIAELPSLLARSASGVQFIYQTLELVAARYGLRDLLVVTDGPDTAQTFRLGRAPLRMSQAPLPSYLHSAISGRPGLHADPPVVGPLAAACVTSLVELALRLDLLVHDASHDALTGLLNRRSYELLLDQAVSRARRYGWPFALVLLDLDDFKVVNDRYGHAAGDAALRAVGAELRAALRGGDVAARLGGDEFALLVAGVENVSSLSPVLGRLKRALERAVPETTVGFSVGVACFPSDTDDPDALTGMADERLYAAKATIG